MLLTIDSEVKKWVFWWEGVGVYRFPNFVAHFQRLIHTPLPLQYAATDGNYLQRLSEGEAGLSARRLCA